MVNWLRNNTFAAAILTVIRILVGYKFLTAGWGKLTGDKPFDATGFLKGAISKASGDHPAVQGWYSSFLESVALPNVTFINILLPWGELLVGVALILGTFTTFATLMAAFMNFNFLFAGTISVNPNLILLEFFLLVAGSNAGRFGIDFFIQSLKTSHDKERRNSTSRQTS